MPLLSATAFTSDNAIHVEFQALETKMQKSLEGLTKIRDQLSIETSLPKPIPVSSRQSERLQQENMSLEIQLKEKDRIIEQERLQRELAENEKNELNKRLKTCLANHASEKQITQEKCNLLEQKQLQLEQERIEIMQKNRALETTIHQLETKLQSEVQAKAQCELFLRDKTEELKTTAQGVLERDQKIEELQDNMEHVQRMLEEKDELLESRIVKAQLDAERYNQLQDKVEQLEKENTMLKQQLLETELDSSPSNMIVLEQEAKHKNLEKDDDDTKEQEMAQLRHELLLSQEKLADRISQNKELESAMERVNEHCNILRNSLNESREESSYRYRK
ncbi:hypothetical protein BD560DRAFT_384607 [Blakeslea trispora]|nr:hypothetical protein BD560DRAFT_384607 [Blakeslea trispora]